MGKRPAAIEMFEGNMGSIQGEDLSCKGKNNLSWKRDLNI